MQSNLQISVGISPTIDVTNRIHPPFVVGTSVDDGLYAQVQVAGAMNVTSVVHSPLSITSQVVPWADLGFEDFYENNGRLFLDANGNVFKVKKQ